MQRDLTRLPAKPFADWLNARLERYEREMASELDDGRLTGAIERLSTELGWSDKRLYRYRHQLKSTTVDGRAVEIPTDVVPRDVVEEAFHAAGEFIWEVYPDLAPEDHDPATITTAWCPRCDEQVVPADDGACMWCGEQTGGAEVRPPEPIPNRRLCPSCGGRKGRTSRMCLRCSRASKFTYAPEDLVCSVGSSECKGVKSGHARMCWNCFRATGGQRGARHHGIGPWLITDEVLEDARRLYLSGLSIAKVAEAIYPRTDYANVQSCIIQLYKRFKVNGWPLRRRAAVSPNHVRARLAAMPQCSHVNWHTGKRCPRRTVDESGRCYSHRPEQIEKARQRLAAIKQNQGASVLRAGDDDLERRAA